MTHIKFYFKIDEKTRIYLPFQSRQKFQSKTFSLSFLDRRDDTRLEEFLRLLPQQRSTERISYLKIFKYKS